MQSREQSDQTTLLLYVYLIILLVFLFLFLFLFNRREQNGTFLDRWRRAAWIIKIVEKVFVLQILQIFQLKREVVFQNKNS